MTATSPIPASRLPRPLAWLTGAALLLAALGLGGYVWRQDLRIAANRLTKAGVARPGQMCHGPLTGRQIVLAPAVRGFGTIQGLGPTPLQAGEYVISIDDGPSPRTMPRLLEILRRHCVTATFFMVGRNAELAPDLARLAIEQGHQVNSHSQTHGQTGGDEPHLLADVVTGRNAVEWALRNQLVPAGDWRFVRLPGGPGLPTRVSPTMLAALNRENIIVFGHDLTTFDWQDRPAAQSYATLFAHFADRGVILFHDGPANTPELLDRVLAELARRGARVVTIALAARGPSRP